MPLSLISPANESTVSNLQIAFEEELNAHARYMAFAAQADADGLAGIASLFRAVAFAEQIHAGNHARVMRRLGGDPIAVLRPVGLGSTLENLRNAVDAEVYEIDTLYPDFLEQTPRGDNSTAQTLTWALEAEKTHARLFTEAVALLEAGETDAWIGTARDFYVRSICGYLTKSAEESRCWVCSNFCHDFEAVR
jgi:rubrerythrin